MNVAQTRLTAQYREARAAYRASQQLADWLGLSERAYCDRYLMIAFGPLIMVESTAAEPTALDRDLAFVAAGEPRVPQKDAPDEH